MEISNGKQECRRGKEEERNERRGTRGEEREERNERRGMRGEEREEGKRGITARIYVARKTAYPSWHVGGAPEGIHFKVS